MTTEDQSPALATTHKPADAGTLERKLWAAYRLANRVTHHGLGVVLTILVVLYFLFCTMFLALRYAVLPNIDRYKSNVEEIATSVIGRPVSIATVHASWRGLRPYLSLSDVVIHNRHGEAALSLPRVSATLSWLSVPLASLRLHSLEIDRPDMDVERETDGTLYVAGLLIEPDQQGEGKGLDWVLSQREIVIRNGWVRWNDRLRNAPELTLSNVDFLLLNNWRRHRFAVTATPPQAFGAPLDIRAEFEHPVFARKIADARQWKGTLFADWRDTDLAIWKMYFNYPVEIQQGKGSVRAWLEFDRTRVVDLTADLTLSNLTTRLRKDLQLINLTRVEGRISARDGVPAARKQGSSGASGNEGATAVAGVTNVPAIVVPPTVVPGTAALSGVAAAPADSASGPAAGAPAAIVNPPGATATTGATANPATAGTTATASGTVSADTVAAAGTAASASTGTNASPVSAAKPVSTETAQGKPSLAGTPASAAGDLGTNDGKGLFSFGSHGHVVALTDFSLETDDGLKLPPTTLSESYVPAIDGQPEKFEIKGTSLDLHTAADFAGRLPLSEAQRRMLAEFAPRGQLKDFSAKWQGNFPDINSYQVRGQFSGLSIKGQPARELQPKTVSASLVPAKAAIPGFTNLNGSLDFTEQGGTVRLNSPTSAIILPGVFADPVLPFEELDLQAKWTLQDRNKLQVQVEQLRFVQEGTAATLSGKHAITLGALTESGKNKSLGIADFSARITSLDLTRISRYLPLRTPEVLRAWLTGALVAGRAQDVAVTLKGDMAQFPFHPEKPGDKPKGQFTVTGKIDKAGLNVAPDDLAPDGKSPKWPLIEEIKGTIALDRTRLEVKGDSARAYGVNFSGVTTVINDLMSPDRILTVEGNTAGPLQDYVRYINSSPVSRWIANFTEETKASGHAAMTLKLQIPMAKMTETKALGVVQFQRNDLMLMEVLPAFQQTSGELRFSETGFDIKGIRANFIGGPMTVSGGTQRDGHIAIRAEGSATSEGMKRSYPSPAMQRLFKHIVGTAKYTAQINVKNKRPEVIVESGLHGVLLDFPAPLKKAADASLPLRFELTGLPSDDLAIQRDEIRLTLGPLIAARYTRSKSVIKDGSSWKVVNGGIGVNAPVSPPDSGLVANVNLKSLNIDAWRNVVATIAGPRIPPAAVAAPAQATRAAPQPAPSGAQPATSAAVAPLAVTPAPPATQASAQSTAKAAGQPVSPAARPAPAPVRKSDDEPAISQYVDPDVLAARTEELTVMGKKLDNVVVGASHGEGVWQANISSDQAAGYVTWTESRSGRGLGRITARLSSLIIPQAAASDVTELLEGRDAATQLPGLDIVAENFELVGKKFGRLELIANNASSPTGREWRISKMAISNSDAALNATGKWVIRGGANLTNMTFALDIANAGKLLDRFGFVDVLRGGKGRLDGDLSWNGLPFSLDIPTLTGQMQLDMAAGQFLKVDPGAAKLLGVLSLQSLPRRLALDFRDVFSEGFAFDGVVGSAALNQGIMRTENFKMKSVAAVVLMDGTIDIARESQNLKVVIIPEINVGAASVAYALVNPVIGLGSFLAQLFLRDPLAKAFTQEYEITGPWKDPAIRKMERGVGAASPADLPPANSVPGGR